MNTEILYSLREEASASLECFGYSVANLRAVEDQEPRRLVEEGPVSS